LPGRSPEEKIFPRARGLTTREELGIIRCRIKGKMPENKKVDAAWKEKARDDKASPEESKKAEELEAEKELPPPDFSVFIAGLGSQGLLALGILPHPVSGKKEKDIGQARYTIDMLSMLEEKTRGNLTEDEATTLRETLYGLRMRFVELAGEEEKEEKQ